MNETNTLLREIRDILSRVGQLGTRVPHHVPGEDVARKVIPKSPRDLASEWLECHPEHRDQPGRWLEQNVHPEGVTISYKTWNRAK